MKFPGGGGGCCGSGGFVAAVCNSNFAILNLYVHKSKDFHSYNPEGLTDYESEATRPGVNFGSEPLSRNYTIGVSLVF